ncbi:hypothetical protein GRI39_06045 [Altererythrobacter indicus]|uniref:Alginate export domain-containing protein n=1 Tax=Altericroceibacterium indicum TaxID=374177 RepID=A0A845A8M5_9SPHN|nr:alginate export family protein [Altericroceibacterium indicum]MXP25603.1 hypothetical protein [Altericroceibacterium indicum]
MTRTLRRWGGAGCCILAASIALPAMAQDAPIAAQSAQTDSQAPQTADESSNSIQARGVKAEATAPAPKPAPRNAGLPPGPYPVAAQGWGPKTGPNFYMIRPTEDWSYLANPAAKDVPLRGLKYIPLGLGDDSYVTLNGYERARFNFSSRPNMSDPENRYEFQSRTMLGADFHFNKNLRVYSELTSAHIFGKNETPHVPVQENDLYLQQLFAELRFPVGEGKAGLMIGRQTFFDGPRLIISPRDNPNVERSLNGVRLWTQWDKFRVTAFALKDTNESKGFLGDAVNEGETIAGFNSSFVLTQGEIAGQKSQIFLDPFFIHYTDDSRKQGGVSGEDRRENYGARLWGNIGRMNFDWTVIKQDGEFNGRKVDAYAVSGAQSIALGAGRKAPRIGFHAELASGGGSYSDTGTIEAFNPIYIANIIYTDTNTITGVNLMGIAPTISFPITDKLAFNGEAAVYWRMDEDDAIYRTNLAPYAGTQLVDGKHVLNIYRGRLRWTLNPNVSLVQEINYNTAGKVLERAGYGDEIYTSTALHLRF